MIYYTVYKVTNKINGKFYIGTHKTDNLNDGYMGSGKYLTYSQNKHGIENFEKEILFVFDTPEEMYKKEAEIVNEDFLAEENTYNLKIGGFGGWDYVNANLTEDDLHTRAVSGRKAANEAMFDKYGPEWRYAISRLGRAKMEDILNKDPDFLKRRNKRAFKGRTHTDETKKRMSESAKGKHAGTKNSQYGTCWVYCIEKKVSKKINKEDLETYVNNGWSKGRKLKF